MEPHFKEKYIPIRAGDTFLARGGMRAVEFKVISVETEDEEDAKYCMVTDETEVEIADEPLNVSHLVFQAACPSLDLTNAYIHTSTASRR